MERRRDFHAFQAGHGNSGDESNRSQPEEANSQTGQHDDTSNGSAGNRDQTSQNNESGPGHDIPEIAEDLDFFLHPAWPMYQGNIAAACIAANLEVAEARKNDPQTTVEQRKQRESNRLTSWHSRERRRIETEVLRERKEALVSKNTKLREENRRLREEIDAIKNSRNVMASMIQPEASIQFQQAPLDLNLNGLLPHTNLPALHGNPIFPMPSNIPLGSISGNPGRIVTGMGLNVGIGERAAISSATDGLSNSHEKTSLLGNRGFEHLQDAGQAGHSRYLSPQQALPNINDAIERYGAPYIRATPSTSRKSKRSTHGKDGVQDDDGAEKKPRARK